MSESVYVVMGTVGEYSDRETWPVVAYRDEATANAHALGASRALEAICADADLRERLAYGEPTAEEIDRLASIDQTLVREGPHGRYTGRFCYCDEPARYGVLRVPLSEAYAGPIGALP